MLKVLIIYLGQDCFLTNTEIGLINAMKLIKRLFRWEIGPIKEKNVRQFSESFLKG